MKQKVFLILICMVLFVDTLLGQSKFGIQFKGESTQDIRGTGLEVATKGGTFSVKFNRKEPTPSLLNIQGPSISMSCSSFSMKGFYGELINLKELTDTLAESGKSFAWGVLLGIVTSLPTIGDVFSKLNAYAKEIQKMLAHACELGSQLGSNLAQGPLKDAVNDALPSIGSGGQVGKFVEDAQEAMGSFVPQLEKILTGEYGDDETKHDSAIDMAMSVSPGSNSLAASFLRSEVNTNAIDMSSNTKKVLYDTLSGGATLHNITFIPYGDPDIKIYKEVQLPTSLTGPTNGAPYEFDAAMFLLVYNFLVYQDNVVAYDKTIAFLDHIAQTLKNITTTQGMSKEDIKKNTSEITSTSESVKDMQEGSANSNSALTVTIAPSTPTDSSDSVKPTLLEFITNQQSSNIIFNIPNVALVHLLKYDTMFVIGVDSLTIADGSGSWMTILNKYSNLEAKARAQVECLFQDDSNTSVIVDGNNGTPETIACNSLPPVIVPQARRMLRIYQQSDIFERDKIKDIVQAHNVMYMLGGVKTAILHAVRMITANNKDASGTVDGNTSVDIKSIPKTKSMKINIINQPALKALIENVDSKIEKLVKQKYNVDIRDFDAYLDRLEKKNKKRGMRGLY